MSNYYDLKCLDCSIDTGWGHGNRMHKELLVVLALRPELEALALAHRRLKPEAFVEYTNFDMYTDHPVSRWAFFFAEHIGHHVVVHSEYGNDAFFGCDKTAVDYNAEPERYKREPIGPRENRSDCRLDFNHEGPCSPIRPDGK